MTPRAITVVGAGLAGSEAAWQILMQGISVELFDIKPNARTPAHRGDGFAELVCSNSLRSEQVENAVGLLKEEMRRAKSLIMEAADCTRIPAGAAHAVDREAFSAYVTKRLIEHPLLTYRSCEVDRIPENGIVIVASGPLTTESLAEDIAKKLGEANLYFFDAAAPIVAAESIDMERVFVESRYGKGTPDYLNCPMDENQYKSFVEAILSAQVARPHAFEEDKVFEGCLPVEVMASRGVDTLRFGPLKPVGLVNPADGKMPYAVVQLRADNAEKTLYNLVGFQTRLTFGEQKRVFSMIPGLEKAVFVRYGVMHRNTYINGPKLLDASFQCKAMPNIYFAGQISGVEGYVESAASGLLCGLNAARQVNGQSPVLFPRETALGALGHYVATGGSGDFQPMNINFGIMAPPSVRIKNKRERNKMLAERALAIVDDVLAKSYDE